MVKIEIGYEQLKKAIEQLPKRDKIRLVEKLQHDAWNKQFRQLLNRIRRRTRKHPVSDQEINEAVKEARRQIYARRH